MAESPSDYVTMDELTRRLSEYLGEASHLRRSAAPCVS
jgi:hypothetical protein